MSDLTDATGSGVSDSPAEAAPPLFDNEQTAAILELVTPLLEAAVEAAVEEARRSTPVPVLRPGTCRAVDASTRTCQVLVDGDDELDASATTINASILGEFPIINGRVMVLFSPPSAVYAITMVPALPPGMVLSYAGAITADATTADPLTQTLPPAGFLRCYGQVVQVQDYAALYAAIGTAFNTGGESAGLQFRLPDLRGRMIAGLDNMGGTDAARLSTANTLGTTMGAETHTIASGNLPSHTHDMANHTHAAGTYAVASHTHDLSNHTHSTPNHSHGAGTYAVASHNHSTPNHQHGFSTSTDGNHSHTGNMVSGAGGATAGGETVATTWGASTSTDGNHSHSGTTNNDGSGTSGNASPGLSGSSASDGSGTSGTPSNNTSGSSAPSLSGSSAVPSTNTTGATGSGTALNHMPPAITLHWVIKY